MSNTNTTDAMAAFLARGGAVTKCPPRDANATPLRKLRRQAELDASDDSEQQAELRAERFGRARLNGASMSEALDQSNAPRRRYGESR
jgi:hypothetical protein